MTLKLSDFDYELPRELIAQYPAASRELSRMLVLDRSTGKILHTDFKDLPAYIRYSDILVLNDTKVINARLIGKRITGGKVEIFLLEDIGEGRFKALIRPSQRIKEGEEISFDNPELKARLLVKKTRENIVEFLSPSDDIDRVLKEVGTTPLPPYIRRKVELLDKERYQTVYARVEGATAAPTAGLHFTEEILRDIVSKGARLTYVTLHVNYGTFAPVKTEDIINHRMHSEDFELSQDAAIKINSVKAEGGRVLAVGTTSCRVLETCSVPVEGQGSRGKGYRVEAKERKTDLFIYPSYKFKMVDALLTNFHLPKSTLLLLVSAFAGDVSRGRYASADKSAFAGRELIFKAYREAIDKKYRFFSYGDCMLII